jgi:hypothetical protein
MTITAEPATDYDEYCYRQYQREQEAEAMTLADVATVETMTEAIEACRSVLPELVYRSLLRLAETTDQRIDEHAAALASLRDDVEEAEDDRDAALAVLDDLRCLARNVRRTYDLTDNEAARLLLHEIEES